MSMLKILFNLSKILSFIRFIDHLVIKLWLYSKDKSHKLAYWVSLPHIQLSTNHLIEPTFYFLHSFWIFLNARTTVQPFQVIIISTIYLSPSDQYLIIFLRQVIATNPSIISCTVPIYINQSVKLTFYFFTSDSKILFYW